MKPFLYLLIVLFSIALPIYSQDKAAYKQHYTEGCYLMLEENFSMALKNFLLAYQIDTTSANLNYKIGYCYLKSASQKNMAEHHLKIASQNTSKSYDELEPAQKSAPVEAFYNLGKAQHINYKFDEAIASFEKYKTLISSKREDKVKDVNRQIAMCQNAKDAISKPTKVIISNIGDTINGFYPDYSPVISADESVLIFTSRREESMGGFKTFSNEYYEDIYISTKKEDGTWSTPKPIDDNINTTGHEATINLTADGQQLIIYKDDDGDGNIYISRLLGDRWSTPAKLPAHINSKYWETHACISSDNNTLYFVSDRPGGYGGRDIYKCIKLPNGEWSLPKNLGPAINTEYDEDAVFIHPDQVTLFFSSKGHKSIGGFDIFYSTVIGEENSEKLWSYPTNIGYPINTPDDDVFYVASADGKRGYYSSSKEGGYGEKDIYVISLEDLSKVQPVALLIGKLLVKQGEEVPSSNEIIVTDVESGTINAYKANTKTGKYILSLIPGKSYDVSYKIDDKEFYKENINVPLGLEYQQIEREIPLKPVLLSSNNNKPEEVKKEIEKPIILEKKQETVVINPYYELFFKYNVRDIDVKSSPYKSLINDVKKYVEINGTINLVIESSASRVPTKSYKDNKDLASNRAATTKDKIMTSLKEAGVDTSKIMVELNSKIQGPDYNNDFLENKAEYEKYQYIKVGLK